MDPHDIEIRRLTRNLRGLAEAACAQSGRQAERVRAAVAEAEERVRAQAQGAVPVPRGRRGRAAVACWDLGHNPAGRAYVLYRLLQSEGYEVDLIGPLWTRYGSALWAPLQGEGLRVRSFPCATLEDFMPKAELLAASRVYDLVYVCKRACPRSISAR